MMNTQESAISRLSQCRRILSHRFRSSALFLAILVLFASAASAQLTTADILGTVTDATGAVVPGANITLINLETNEQRSGQSNGTGDFSFTLLPVGHYSVTVKAPGFQVSITKDLAVEAGDCARADDHLQLGSESTVVEVTASTPLLQADSATVSSSVTAMAVQDLPLNGRNFVQLVQLVPGANEGPGNGATPLNSGGQDRPNQIKDARLSHKSLAQFFDTTAFAPQPLGTIGSAQRNSLFGPDFRHVDLSIFKDFPVTEGVNVQFRAESFNISNTPNFYIGNGSSGASFGNPTFGGISQTDPNYTPREYQFALKVHF